MKKIFLLNLTYRLKFKMSYLCQTEPNLPFIHSEPECMYNNSVSCIYLILLIICKLLFPCEMQNLWMFDLFSCVVALMRIFQFCLNIQLNIFASCSYWTSAGGQGAGVSACAGLTNQLQCCWVDPAYAWKKHWHSYRRQAVDWGGGDTTPCTVNWYKNVRGAWLASRYCMGF